MTTSRVAIVGLVVGMAAAAGWWVWPSPQARQASALATTMPVTAPALPITESPPTTAQTVADPTTAQTVADPGGSKLRIGVARAVSSPALIATANGPRVPLFSEASDTEPGDVVDNPTFEGLPVTGLVMDRRGDWLNIQISRRPNEATAWVRAADFILKETPYKIRVDSSAHRLTLTDRGTTVLDVPVANGTGGTPTPTGTFFVDGLVQLADPTGPYGSYQLSLAAFSNVLTSFGGGNGQIALHGTNSPDLVGTSVSHGCVRMTTTPSPRWPASSPSAPPWRSTSRRLQQPAVVAVPGDGRECPRMQRRRRRTT